MGQPTADQRIEQRRPEHITGDIDAEDLDAAGHAPENHREGHQADHITDQAETEAQRGIGEIVEVFGQALVGVVGVPALLQAVVVLLAEPGGEMPFRQPAAPADSQHLGQVQAVYGGQDEYRGNSAEHEHQMDKAVQILVLQGVVEVPVPAVEPDLQPHPHQRQGDDDDQQQPGHAFFLAAPVGDGQLPDTGEEAAANGIVRSTVFGAFGHVSGSQGLRKRGAP
ncbi:hypothetical protein D9M71_345200 [compost metagenome]